MEVQTIDSRMRALTKRYRELDRGNTSKIWNELIRVIDLYLSGCQSDAFETFYTLFIKNAESLRLGTIPDGSSLYRSK